MRKFLLAAAAVSAIATPAMARDGSPYVGIEAGALFARDLNFDLVYDDGEVIYDGVFGIDHKTGTDIDLIGGYDFGMFRLELELGRKRASHDEYTFSDAEVAGAVDGDGRTRVFSIMGNALADFGSDDGLGFYVGGGVGTAKTKLTFNDTDVGQLSVKDSSLAWQLLAGVRYAVSPNVDVGLKYRYFRTKFDDNPGEGFDDISGKFRSHSLLASLIFNFGAPAEVIAPPPPPPEPAPYVEPAPAPAPATQTCPDGTVIAMDAVCPAPPPPPAPAGERGL
jgi:opacity protein-like surface antigen